MSYYYQDMEYGYHGDVNHEYELYSDSAEPDHHYYEPPKPDYHNDYADHGNGGTPTQETEPEGFGFEGRDNEAHECELEWEAFKQAEIKYADQGGYLQEDRYHETEANRHHQDEPKYEYDNRYEHGVPEHDDDDDVCAFTPADRDAAELLTQSITTHRPAHLIPTYVPSYPFHSTPAPIPRLYDLHNANQRGHMTMPNHMQNAHTLARTNYNACVGYDTAKPSYHNDGAVRGNDGTPIEWETEPMGLEYRDKMHECKPNWEAFE